MNDLLSIITTAEGQMRAASREAFKFSATRAASGKTDEAKVAAHKGVELSDLADALKFMAGNIRKAVELQKAMANDKGGRVVEIAGPDGAVLARGRILGAKE